jgi:hypothetical protein
MKKKLRPDEQTKEIGRAKWEFLKRNPEEYKEIEKNISELLNLGFDIDEEVMIECMQRPAASDATLMFLESWLKILHKNLAIILESYEEKNKVYREQILKDATEILNRILYLNPSECLLLVCDLTRSKKAIMGEVEAIVDKQLGQYKKEKEKVQSSIKRLKWLSNTDELLEVWDLYERAGQMPGVMSFKRIAKKVKRPVSTVKSQWRLAYEKIYGKAYDPGTKYANEETRALADAFCAKCPYNGKCYRNGDCYPCAEYMKIAGKEKPEPKHLEFRDEIYK